jgi:hypothetical protein
LRWVPRFQALEEVVADGDPAALSDDYVLVKPDETRILREPSRLASITITPDGKEIGVREAVHFVASGADQVCTVMASVVGVQARATV